MLDLAGKYNKLSDKLREEIMTAYKAAGKRAVYKFDIAHKNPSFGERGQPEFIFPMLYELAPITYEIIDKHTGQPVLIGIVKETNDKGEPVAFERVWVREFHRGVYELNLTEDTSLSRNIFAYMYLHPKHNGGKYQSKSDVAKFKLADKVGDAKSSYSVRERRMDAEAIARSMTAEEVRDFASALGWDESDDTMVLKDQIMEMAGSETDNFIKLTESNISYKASIKRALDQRVIEFVPVENKYIWANSRQTIASLEKGDGTMQGSIEQFADWLLTSKNGLEIYNRLVTLTKAEATA